jgi:glycosyltransferase involved in cell wall biosynthesis
MDAEPRVAVVIAAHNAEDTLARAVESVRRQTYEGWCAVVADDASSDATLEVAVDLARSDNRIRVVALVHNSGPAVARNAAVAAAGGSELLALLDADDYWLPMYLERQIATYDAARARGVRVGAVACDALVETPDGRWDETFGTAFGWRDEIDYDAMLAQSYVFVGAVIARSSFDEVGAFSPDCWGSEDYDLWLRLLERGYEIVTVSEPLAVYSHHPQGLSKDQLQMADASIVAFQRALERGAATPSQLVQLRRRLRHYRALRKRAHVQEAWRARRPLAVAGHLACALPLGMAAFFQDPRRWPEWGRDALTFLRRSTSRGPARRSVRGQR